MKTVINKSGKEICYNIAEQATDVYLNQDDIDTFIEERINACVRRNINLL